MPKIDKFLDSIASRYVGAVETEAIDPKTQLSEIATVSQNVRATWFGLLTLLSFVGVTLLSHQDVDFFNKDVATKLPIVGVTVPVKAFFVTAPLLTASVYAYLHLYLITLWDKLAEAPAKIDGQALTDRVFPWLISYAALWYRDRRRKDGSAAPRPLGFIVVLVSVLLGWVFGVAVMFGLWIRSMPLHNEWLTLWIGGCTCLTLLVGLISLLTVADRMTGASRVDVARVSWPLRFSGIALLIFTGAISWETTEGGLVPYAEEELPPLLVSANLREAKFVPRPPGWKPFELWLRDFRRESKSGDPEQAPIVPTEQEIVRWRLIIAGLDQPVMREWDLRGADLTGAFLPGADLRSARLDGAILRAAVMPSVNLTGSRMVGVDLSVAELQGAKLQGADMRSVSLFVAELQGAELFKANMERAYMQKAELHGADLTGANLRGADLFDARVRGVDLSGAKLDGTFWGSIDLYDVDLDGMQLQGAQLGYASELASPDLPHYFHTGRMSEIFAANCNELNLIGTILDSTKINCVDSNITQDSLKYTVGNEYTTLKEPLQVWSCLVENEVPGDVKEQINAALAFHIEQPMFAHGRRFGRLTRSEFRNRLFCDPGEVPKKVGRSINVLPNKRGLSIVR